MQQHVWSAREQALGLSVHHPKLMSAREGVEPLLDSWPLEPAFYGFRAQLDEHAFAAVFHRGEPLRFQGDLRALNVGFILPVNIGNLGFKSREPDQRKHLTQPVELDHGFDAVAALRVAPSSIGQPARVKVGIDRYVIAETLRRGEHRFQLHLLYRPLVRRAALNFAYGL